MDLGGWRRVAAGWALVGLGALVAGCGGAVASPAGPVAARTAGIEVVDPYAPAPRRGRPAAVYLTVVSTDGVGDTLERVSSPAARGALLVDEQRSASFDSFASVAQVAVPARHTVRLQPDGLHVLLLRPRRVLTAGDRVRITLVFARAGAVTVEVPVVGAAT